MHIDDVQCHNTIWCGYFNLVLDPTINFYNYKGKNESKSRNTVLKIIETYAYVDPFRQLHEDLHRYA